MHAKTYDTLASFSGTLPQNTPAFRFLNLNPHIVSMVCGSFVLDGAFIFFVCAPSHRQYHLNFLCVRLCCHCFRLYGPFVLYRGTRISKHLPLLVFRPGGRMIKKSVFLKMFCSHGWCKNPAAELFEMKKYLRVAFSHIVEIQPNCMYMQQNQLCCYGGCRTLVEL